jgi:DNA-binding response OmpR family regulator
MIATTVFFEQSIGRTSIKQGDNVFICNVGGDMSHNRILIVEDEPINLEALAEVLGEEGYEVHSAINGANAWAKLTAEAGRFDVVLLDRLMPDMDGIEILRRMKDQPAMSQTPVIMQTSMSGDADVAEGLKAGAYYYLTKPFAAETLVAIVAAAVRDYRDYLDLQLEVSKATRTLGCLDAAEFSFRTTDEARDIATLLAQVSPDPGRIVLGLSELMLNAVEHGNLGITYAEKSALGGGEPLAEEIARRLANPDFAQRRATIEFRRTPAELRFIVRDRGSGFDWRRYLEMSPERAFDTHGRGIAMSRMISFDRLQYLGNGNEVEAVVILPNVEH